MNIKEEYIDKTKNYLCDLRKKICEKEILKNKKEILEEELEILNSRQKLNDGISFENELGIKSSTGAKGIDDLIVSLDSQICCLEAQIENIDSQIDRIERDIMMYEIYTRGLNDTEEKIIKMRYFDKKDNNSFRRIARTIMYSKSHIANMHDNTIKELAYYIYGEKATYN